MLTRQFISPRGMRPLAWLCTTIPLLLAGVLIGRISDSASNQLSRQLIPLPKECETTWKQLKVAIEHTTNADVVLTKFTSTVPQYPNLVGFVEIVGADTLDPVDLRGYLDTAEARCYASLRSSVSMSSGQFGRLLQLTLADIRERANSPIYMTLGKDQITLHYNEPLQGPGD